MLVKAGLQFDHMCDVSLFCVSVISPGSKAGDGHYARTDSTGQCGSVCYRALKSKTCL